VAAAAWKDCQEITGLTVTGGVPGAGAERLPRVRDDAGTSGEGRTRGNGPLPLVQRSVSDRWHQVELARNGEKHLLQGSGE
jgi:hypothetical protein